MTARKNYLFTSESVSEGHPDKVCDQISDAVIDMILAREPEARVAVETAATTNKVVLMGEVKISDTNAVTPEEISACAREVIRDIGYRQKGFHFKTCSIDCYVHEQSQDIAQGVDAADNKDEGAGDQGIMFGYATNETPELMPAPILYAHKVLKRLAEVRHSGKASQLGPDAKSQFTVEYRDGKPARIDTVVLSTQHLDGSMTSDDVADLVKPYIREVVPEGWLDAQTVWHVNPTGRFVIGGPDGDAGLTAARSSSTPMAARRLMAAARSPARTRPKWTARRPMPRAISPRTWSPPVWRSAARSSFPMPSAYPSRCRSMSTATAPHRSIPRGSSRRSATR